MYYRITDEDASRLHENCLNIVKRNCRIGKVHPKPKHWAGSKLLDGLTGQPVYPNFPSTYPPVWWDPNTSSAEHLVPLPHGVCM